MPWPQAIVDAEIFTDGAPADIPTSGPPNRSFSSVDSRIVIIMLIFFCNFPVETIRMSRNSPDFFFKNKKLNRGRDTDCFHCFQDVYSNFAVSCHFFSRFCQTFVFQFCFPLLIGTVSKVSRHIHFHRFPIAQLTIFLRSALSSTVPFSSRVLRINNLRKNNWFRELLSTSAISNKIFHVVCGVWCQIYASKVWSQHRRSHHHPIRLCPMFFNS